MTWSFKTIVDNNSYLTFKSVFSFAIHNITIEYNSTNYYYYLSW